MDKLKIERINKSSVVDQVITWLTNAIIEGQIKPGDKIPTEADLVEAFGVGRNSIREAIKILVSYGVLEIRRAEGTYVRKGFSNSMLNPLIYGIILSKDTSSLGSLMELREMIDVGIIELVCKKTTPDQLQRIKKKYDDLMGVLNSPSIDLQKAFEADNAFHDEIAKTCQNPLIENMNIIVRKLTSKMRQDTVYKHIRENKVELFKKSS